MFCSFKYATSNNITEASLGVNFNFLLQIEAEAFFRISCFSKCLSVNEIIRTWNLKPEIVKSCNPEKVIFAHVSFYALWYFIRNLFVDDVKTSDQISARNERIWNEKKRFFNLEFCAIIFCTWNCGCGCDCDKMLFVSKTRPHFRFWSIFRWCICAPDPSYIEANPLLHLCKHTFISKSQSKNASIKRKSDTSDWG